MMTFYSQSAAFTAQTCFLEFGNDEIEEEESTAWRTGLNDQCQAALFEEFWC